MEQAAAPGIVRRWAEKIANVIIAAPTSLGVEHRDPQLDAAIAELRRINDTLSTIATLLERR